MALGDLVIWQPSLHIGTSAHWWMMQVGFVIGYSRPVVNRWLIRRGWNEKIDRRADLAEMVEAIAPQPERAAAPAR